MEAGTKQANGRANDLSPGLVAAYRAYPAMDLDNTLRAMAAFLAHGKFSGRPGTRDRPQQPNGRGGRSWL